MRNTRTQIGLAILQDADCKLSRETRGFGPQGYRASLRQEGGRSLASDEDVAYAHAVMSHLCKIRCEQNRFVVALAALTADCDAVHTVRSIAKILKCGPTTVQRRLESGIAEIFADIEREHLLAA